MLDTLISFAISLLVGLLIGLEREHNHVEGAQAIGIRTFILCALLGTIAATINQFLFTITITIFVFVIISLGYIRQTGKERKHINIGITTETSAAIVYCLGYLIPSAKLVAIIVSSLVLLVLVERQRLHILARNTFKSHEIETAIILIIFTLGIVPILPNYTIDPWNLFNPRNFGILIATIAAIQFAGYIAVRLFGERFGVAMTGLLGGFVSSTAVFASLPHTIHTHYKYQNVVLASGILATTAMLIEIISIILVASNALLFFIIKPILVMIGFSLVIAYLLLSYHKENTQEHHLVTSRLSIISILKTSIFLGCTLFLIAIAKRLLGNEGIFIVSFLGGLFEIHGISLATALLYLDQHLTTVTATQVLYIAVFASFISKIFLLWTFTPAKFALQMSCYLLLIMLSGGLTYWLVYL